MASLSWLVIVHTDVRAGLERMTEDPRFWVRKAALRALAKLT